jgi:hypothetical protein
MSQQKAARAPFAEYAAGEEAGERLGFCFRGAVIHGLLLDGVEQGTWDIDENGISACQSLRRRIFESEF